MRESAGWRLGLWFSVFCILRGFVFCHGWHDWRLAREAESRAVTWKRSMVMGIGHVFVFVGLSV